MKHFLHVLWMILCFPVLPIVGIPGAGGGADGEKSDEDTNGTHAGEGDDDPDEDESSESDDEEVTMKQSELDELLDKQFRKGARNAQYKQRKAAKEKPGEKDDDDASKTEEKAEEKLKAANDRLLRGVVRELAADLQISAKGATAALKLAGFEECFDNSSGELDEDAVKDALEDFLKEYPEFSVHQNPGVEDEEPPKAWGLRQKGKGTAKRDGVEEAFAALNPDIKI